MKDIYDIRSFPIIGELKEEDLFSIRPYLYVKEYEENTIILKQQQIGTDFHIILQGTLGVYVEKETKVHIATLEAGHFFGEMSCLTGSVVSATVQANTKVKTVSMSRDGMLQLMDKSIIFRNHMIEAMTERIASSNDRVLEEHTRSSAVLRQLQMEQQTKYGQLVGQSKFMQQIRVKIPQLANEKEPLSIIGEKGVGKSHIAWEIHAKSRQSEFPILSIQGDSFSMEEWKINVQAAKRGMIILEQADSLPADLLNRLLHSLDETRIIMTAKRQLPVHIEQLEVIPLRERKEDILDLIHVFILEAGFPNPEALISQEAMNMIENFPFLSGNIEELKRLVHDALIRSHGKIIRNTHLRFGGMREPGARPKIGLALGSGSVKGAAHVGVIKALEQANIPIDLIAGTSVGAFIGVLYAGGQPISNFERILPTVRWSQLVQPTMPNKGLVRNQRMARFIEKYLGPVDFKDLSIPFAAVASDAINGDAYILNEGKVSQAICASTAIPGVMKPVRYGDKLLLDGAVAQPVPVALAKSMGADIVIASNVSTPRLIKKEPKNFVATILNTIDVMSERIIQDELQLADFVLTPWLETNQLHFKESATYIQRGLEVTNEIILDIKKRIKALESN